MQVFEEKGKLKYPGRTPLRAEKTTNKQSKWKKGGLLPRGIYTNETSHSKCCLSDLICQSLISL